VASALSFLHGIDIVHCDLKPENLMLSTESRTDGVVKVIDFGTAELLDENGVAAVSSSEVGTTPAYCPPEILMAGATKKNPSMDMWAVGIILYIMLVGAHPFDLGGDAAEELICDRVVNRKSPPLRDSRHTSHLSDSAINLIEKLLSWDEETRLTADEMLQHPWVQGITANNSKIQDSDNKLSKLRPFKSGLEAKVFKDFISWSDEGGQEKGAGSSKMSLIERSFRKFDTNSKGFITVKDMGKGLDEAVDSEEEELSLTAFSDMLSEHMQNFYFKKGEIVFNEGDEGKDMFFLNSGVVEVTTKGGFCTTLSAGDFVGEGALLNNKKRSGTVRCITPVHAIKITKEYFAKYLSASDSVLNLKMLETSKSRDTSREIFGRFSCLLSENIKKDRSFKQGDTIYREGDTGGEMLFIKSGVVSVTNKDGFRATLKQGDFVGEGALLSNKPRTGTVTCLTPVEGMSISRDYFEKFMASSNTDLRLTMYKENKSREQSRMQMILRQQKHLRPLKFSKGDLLFKEGDTTKNLYIVMDGEVDLEVGKLSASRVKGGDVVGEHSLIFESPRNASARCVTDECNMVEIGPRAFRSLLDSSSSLKDALGDLGFRREFQKAVVLYTKKDFPTTEKELRDAFATIQENRHSGIVLKDAERLLKNMNPSLSEEEIKEIFQALDLGGRGSVNFETFKVLFFTP
jgi:CRP-like cAMP-binding protein